MKSAMKSKILITCASFYPVISPRSHRATELAKEFAREGHHVTVLTIKDKKGYDEFEKKHNITIKDFGKKKFSFDHYREKKERMKYRKVFRRLFSYLFLWPQIKITPLVYRALQKEVVTQKEHRYDLLISFAVPHATHWGVALAMMKNRHLAHTWIADCGDPFMGNEEKKRGFPFYFRWVENWFCIKPDFLTIPVKAAIHAYPQECRHKIHVIPQGFDFTNLPVIQNKNDSTRHYPVFAYAGKFNDTRDPRQFLEYLSDLDHTFNFIVYTKSEKYLDGYAEQLGDKLIVKDYIPREQLLYELSAVDFLINFENTGGVQVPSKLIDYALIDKPILSLKAHDLNYHVLDEFMSGDYKHRIKMGDVSRYDIKKNATQFLDLVNEKKKIADIAEN